MEVDEFVRDTLTQIAKGVHDAKKLALQHGTRVSPGGHTVKNKDGSVMIDSSSQGDVQGWVFPELITFDLAVTVEENKEAKGGGGLRIAGIGIGGEAGRGTRSETVSRIHFSVPVLFPVD